MTSDHGKRNGPREGAVEPADKPLAGYAVKGIPRPSPLQLDRRKRVIAYVDGFNLYYGMHEKFGRKYLWLDLDALAKRLVKPYQRLVAVKYFTAPMRDDPDSAARQRTYLSALETKGVEVIPGRFQEKTVDCRHCGGHWRSYDEKESDVNLCVTLLDDVHSRSVDTALLVSGDSDMVPAIRLARRQRPEVRVIAVFPPDRVSVELQKAADGAMFLGAAPLRQSQFPERVEADNDRALTRPYHWS